MLFGSLQYLKIVTLYSKLIQKKHMDIQPLLTPYHKNITLKNDVKEYREKNKARPKVGSYLKP